MFFYLFREWRVQDLPHSLLSIFLIMSLRPLLLSQVLNWILYCHITINWVKNYTDCSLFAFIFELEIEQIDWPINNIFSYDIIYIKNQIKWVGVVLKALLFFFLCPSVRSLGNKPAWDFACTFKIIVDDFLLRHLATDVITLELNMVCVMMYA